MEYKLPKKAPSRSVTAMIGKSLVAVSLEGLIDVNKEIERQNKKLDVLAKEKVSLNGRIDNPRFLESAPKEVIEQTKERITEINQQASAILNLLKSLED